jgi:formylglycine-generating enzyme required for sulfatase activity
MDNFHETYDGAPTDGSAWFNADTNWKVYRGGSFQDRGFDGRVSTRWGDFGRAQKTRGFRLVMEVPPPKLPKQPALPLQKK